MEEENNVLQYPISPPPVEPPPPSQKKSGAGVALGLILCGAAIMLFPRAIAMPFTLALIFEIIGFLVFLVGVLGACVEVDNTRRNTRRRNR